ncbi:hypothetical protein FE257_000874 [Aspergillus nanangensis]|uniref:Zn(2)-C6 fungal-type domain-containing protein n=1 Tax=Aspergillus nanangensis TaxID=2582783 RepID=A0AAD4CEH1_ASPNN|nr:hypothetical protein FE257_000874 [Aspergillus nanangensis]
MSKTPPAHTVESRPESRLACDVCRERKVRCDRGHPKCGRCTRLGNRCTYYGRKNYRRTIELDLPRHLAELQDRLSKAEALLAQPRTVSSGLSYTAASASSSAPASECCMPCAPAYNALPELHMPPTPVWSQTSVPGQDSHILDLLADPLAWDRTDDGGNLEPCRSSEFQPFAEAPTTPAATEAYDFAVKPRPTAPLALPPVPGNTPEEQQQQQQQQHHHHQQQQQQQQQHHHQQQQQPIPEEEEHASEEQVPDLVSMYRNYFEVFYPTLPILNQYRFFSDIASDPKHPPTRSLSYAVALMGTMVVVSHDGTVQQQCYRLARKYAELCERDEHHADLNFFQSLIFILRYELDSRQLTSAWMTLGRAIRLAQVLKLHQLDQPASGGMDESDVHVSLPSVHEQTDLEERRRSFWALYVLESYTSMRAGLPCQIDPSQIQVALAAPGQLGPDFQATPMPLLTNNLDLSSDSIVVTAYSSIVLMASLARRCMRHIEQPDTGSGFWDHHYTLSEAINSYMASLHIYLSVKATRENPAAFSFLMNLCAVDLYLHEAAIDQAERQGLPPSIVTESRRRSTADALKITSTIRHNYPVLRVDGDIFAIQGTFMGWPLVMGVRALARELKCATDLTSDGIANALRFLFSTLDQIETADGYWHQLVAGAVETLQEWDEEHDGFGSLMVQGGKKGW